MIVGHFHMTKYSSVLKAKIVTEYQRGGISSNALAKKYNIYDGSQVRRWARQAEADGLMSIKVKHTKRTYTQQFKLTVLDYVQTNGVTGEQAAQYFDIDRSQVYSWARIVREQGVAGLRPKSIGRPVTTSKRKNKRNGEKIFKTIEPTKEEEYQQEIYDLKTKLRKAEMDRDILKALAAMTKDSQTHSAPKRKRV